MPASTPRIVTGTATPVATVLTLAQPFRQLLVENSGDTEPLLITWNGASGSWSLVPGARLGVTLLGGVTTVTLATAATSTAFQVLLQP